MINLLPKSKQKEVRAAYGNTLLLRYVILSTAALLFLAVALFITYVVLTREINHAEVKRQENEQRAAGYVETRKAAIQLRSDLVSAKTLFDNEVRYSKLLTRFSQLLPNGAAISELELNQQSLKQPVNIDIKINSREAVETLEKNFNNSPYIKSISLGSINTNNESSRFPYTVNVEFSFDGSITQ